MSIALNLATIATGFAVTGPHAARVRAFAEFAILQRSVEAARDAWAEIYPDGLATPYQSKRFVRLWLETIVRAEGIEPLIVVARDERGRASAILPLAIRSRAGARIGEQIGGKHANFHGRFPFAQVSSPSVTTLADFLRRVAKAARLSTPGLFVNQPKT